MADLGVPKEDICSHPLCGNRKARGERYCSDHLPEQEQLDAQIQDAQFYVTQGRPLATALQLAGLKR